LSATVIGAAVLGCASSAAIIGAGCIGSGAVTPGTVIVRMPLAPPNRIAAWRAPSASGCPGYGRIAKVWAGRKPRGDASAL
jgi:hypothetical protein